MNTIDPTEIYEGRKPDTLTANSIDPHPNEAVHREVAELIHRRMVAEGLD